MRTMEKTNGRGEIVVVDMSEPSVVGQMRAMSAMERRPSTLGGFATVALMAGAGMSALFGGGLKRRTGVKRPMRSIAWRGSCRTKGYYRPKFKGSNEAKAGARMARKRLKLGTRQARSMKRMRASQRPFLIA